jgi:hypothetical protein
LNIDFFSSLLSRIKLNSFLTCSKLSFIGTFCKEKEEKRKTFKKSKEREEKKEQETEI